MKLEDLTPQQVAKINKALANEMVSDVMLLIYKVIQEEREAWAERYWKKHKKDILAYAMENIDVEAIVTDVADEIAKEIKHKLEVTFRKGLY